MCFPDEIWQATDAVNDAIPEKWGLFWNDTAFESALGKPADWLKNVFKSAKRLSLLKTQAFVVKSLNNYLRRPNLAISAV
jgi:hypothetical protein